MKKIPFFLICFLLSSIYCKAQLQIYSGGDETHVSTDYGYSFMCSDGTYKQFNKRGANYLIFLEKCPKAREVADSISIYFSNYDNAFIREGNVLYNLVRARQLILEAASIYSNTCMEKAAPKKNYSSKYETDLKGRLFVYKSKEDFFENKYEEYSDEKVYVPKIKGSNLTLMEGSKIDFKKTGYFGFSYDGFIYFYDQKKGDWMLYAGGKEIILGLKCDYLKYKLPPHKLQYDKQMYYTGPIEEITLNHEYYDKDFKEISFSETIKKYPTLYKAYKDNGLFGKRFEAHIFYCKIMNEGLGY